jgi:uncharacterized phiE125 gp8 family phage protein
MILLPDKTQLVTAPDGFPVTLVEAKAQLTFTQSVDDDLFRMYLNSATNHAETFTGRKLVRQTWDIWAQSWPRDGFFELPFGWLSGVTGIWYTDTNGVETEFAAANYDVSIYHTLGQMSLGYEKSWPTTTLAPVDPIRIRFTCGRLVADEWVADTVYAEGDYVIPTVGNGLVYTCSTGGTSDSTEPAWGLTIAGTTSDNTVIWTTDSRAIDEQIRQAILITVADSYEYREDKLVTQGAQLLNLNRFRSWLWAYRLVYVRGM